MVKILVLGLSVGGLLICALAILWSRRLLRPPAPPRSALPSAPGAPPPARPRPAPPTPAQRSRAGLAQASARALRRWSRALVRCPACGASEAPGAIRSQRRDRHRVDGRLPDGRGFGFEAWTFELRCDRCPFELRFPDTDAAPAEAVSLPPRHGPKPVRSWEVRERDGALAGELLIDGEGRCAGRVSPEASGRGRSAIEIAAALMQAVVDLEVPGVEAPSADALRAEVVNAQLSLLGAYGGRLEEPSPAPGLESGDPSLDKNS